MRVQVCFAPSFAREKIFLNLFSKLRFIYSDLKYLNTLIHNLFYDRLFLEYHESEWHRLNQDN
jgi:hypothetical protein